MSKLWEYRGATDGAAFFAAHVAPPATVVEAGCGTGLVGERLAARGFNDLTGCDISARMLELAQAKAVYGGGLFRTDIGEMPFSDAGFDALVCIAVLTYAASIERVFAEFDRVVRPGGTIVFSHRPDLEHDCGFDAALARRVGRTWIPVAVSEPQLYYPRQGGLPRRDHRPVPRLSPVHLAGRRVVGAILLKHRRFTTSGARLPPPAARDSLAARRARGAGEGRRDHGYRERQRRRAPPDQGTRPALRQHHRHGGRHPGA